MTQCHRGGSNEVTNEGYCHHWDKQKKVAECLWASRSKVSSKNNIIILVLIQPSLCLTFFS